MGIDQCSNQVVSPGGYFFFITHHHTETSRVRCWLGVLVNQQVQMLQTQLYIGQHYSTCIVMLNTSVDIIHNEISHLNSLI